MNKASAFCAAAVLAGLAALVPPAAAQAPAAPVPTSPGAITAPQWQAWRDRFVAEDGRIVDDGNHGVSHSEGQGYGLLLAVLANERTAFERIWSFTRAQLMLRDDGLAAWHWDRNSEPHVTDINDAADGDILIAYALALAGDAWNAPELTAAAREMAVAIGRVLVRRSGGRTILLPGATGFGEKDRPDGPIVNLSYWVFEALPVLARLAPGVDWTRLSADGCELIRRARFGPAQLPADWMSLRGAAPRPANGFPRQFGYDAVRIPLYLMRAGITDRALLERFARAWGPDGAPAVVGLDDGKPGTVMGDPGYRMIAAALSCLLDGRPIPAELKTFQPTSYYPSTLHLLALAAMAQYTGDCP